LIEPDPLQRMAARVEQCRRLAAATTDEQTRAVLLQMADEGELDMKRLEAERQGRRTEI
jgi:hypothetical protein